MHKLNGLLAAQESKVAIDKDFCLQMWHKLVEFGMTGQTTMLATYEPSVSGVVKETKPIKKAKNVLDRIMKAILKRHKAEPQRFRVSERGHAKFWFCFCMGGDNSLLENELSQQIRFMNVFIGLDLV